VFTIVKETGDGFDVSIGPEETSTVIRGKKVTKAEANPTMATIDPISHAANLRGRVHLLAAVLVVFVAYVLAILAFTSPSHSSPMAENAPVFCGVSGVSATTYGRAEDVRVVPVIVAELKFRNIQRQILAADLVEAAHDAALQQRLEAVNGLRMHHAIDVLPRGMIDGTVIVNLVQRIVGSVLVSRDQADLQIRLAGQKN
jgi:hypothetical protein